MIHPKVCIVYIQAVSLCANIKYISHALPQAHTQTVLYNLYIEYFSFYLALFIGLLGTFIL